MIDFSKIDKKRVLALCQYPEAVSPLATFLKEKGFEVNLQRVPGEFFQNISQFKPGFVMISNEMNLKMGKVFPHFIQKKFNIPVLLFPEIADKANLNILDENKDSEVAGIRSIKSSEKELVLSELEQFEGRYKAQMSALQNNANINFSQLKAARHKRQSALLQKLAKKIQAGPHRLFNQEELEMIAIKIADPSGQGSFLVFTDLPEGKNLQDLQGQLSGQIETSDGQTLKIESIDFKIPRTTVLQLKDNSDKALHGHWGVFPVSIFYYSDTAVSHHPDLSLFEGGYLIPVEEWWGRMPMTFDAFIYMKTNAKILLYVRKGKFFQDKQMTNFILQSQCLWVKGDEFHHFELMKELTGLIERTRDTLAIAA